MEPRKLRMLLEEITLNEVNTIIRIGSTINKEKDRIKVDLNEREFAFERIR